jgi:predicted nuclease with TOPRIM domain
LLDSLTIIHKEDLIEFLSRLKKLLDKVDPHQQNSTLTISIDNTHQQMSAKITYLEDELNMIKQKHALLEDIIYRLEGELKHLRSKN